MINKILILLVVFMVVVLAAYLWFQPNSPPLPQIPNGEEFLLGPTEATPSAQLTEKLANLIKVEPKNKEKLIKSIVTTNSCNNTIGIISYRDPLEGYYRFMTINNQNLGQTEDAKRGLEDTEKFIDGEIEVEDFESHIDQAFRDYCGGAYSYYIKDLSGIKYPGMDKLRVVMADGGQGLFGSMEVRVFAKKGDNFVRLYSSIQDANLYDEMINQCDPEIDPKKADECYKEKLRSNTKLEELALREAGNLVKIFEVNP